MTKYIIVTGGVLSGLGKGIASASIGHLLSHHNNVVPIKLDGYLNTDPGTMNPYEHGEVFVLDDGTEADMDFGHYERFLGINCNGDQSLTMGKVFEEVRNRERKGDYLGKTVQLIPHVTDHIKDKYKSVGKEDDIVIIEVGGTVGDIENELFIEAARQLSMEVGKENCMFIHLTYVPKPPHVNEQKSKPTQQSVKLLQERGIYPDIIIGRSEEDISREALEKISTFCNVSKDSVFSAPDVNYVYEIPKRFYDQGMGEVISNKLSVKGDGASWSELIKRLYNTDNEINIAICGKYTGLEDSYASINEAITHCMANTKTKINTHFVETTDIEKEEDVKKCLSGMDGIIIPGGFGKRGVEGKLKVIEYARENKIPFLGLCFGLQLAVIEYARNVCGIENATSEEFDKDSDKKVIAYLPGQDENVDKGGTLRLGSYESIIDENSKVYDVYGSKNVKERHRHRYEVNPEYHEVLKRNGLNLSGMSPDGRLVEFISLEDHPFFIGTQAHPELKSSLDKPAPLFLSFVKSINGQD